MRSHATDAEEDAVSVKGTWRRAASNVMLGIALGLLAYYALTTAVGWLGQSGLRRESKNVAVFAASDPEQALEVADAPLEWDGWEAEDRAYWMSLASGEGAFGRLVIDDIELDTLVAPGVSAADLRQGPGWIDWTGLPGPEGTCGIAGHRTTYAAPFRRLDELEPGDTIDLYSPYRRYRYDVVQTLIVRPDETYVVESGTEPMLTLTACHPPYSAQYRLAVQARLVEVRRTTDSEAGM